jgi:hypothetical protein
MGLGFDGRKAARILISFDFQLLPADRNAPSETRVWSPAPARAFAALASARKKRLREKNIELLWNERGPGGLI